MLQEFGYVPKVIGPIRVRAKDELTLGDAKALQIRDTVSLFVVLHDNGTVSQGDVRRPIDGRVGDDNLSVDLVLFEDMAYAIDTQPYRLLLIPARKDYAYLWTPDCDTPPLKKRTHLYYRFSY